ncbi:MAG: TetR/AcrR family transcriptional regulator [Acidobacteriota bacterium]|nr:MAG: TetR/AcrR family transcriptional regulator [Acidobacteriota bacterium]
MDLDSSNGLNRKEREFLRHRGEILAASESVFSEKGYVSATMEEIAQRSEFAVGTLYKFFENKADLYRETVLRRTILLEQVVVDAICEADGPSDKIQAYYWCRVELFWKHLPFHRIFLGGPLGTMSEADLQLVSGSLERYDRMVAYVSGIFRDGIERGEFQTLNPDLMVLALEGILRAYFDQFCRLDDPVRDRNQEVQLFELFMKGVSR